MTARAWSRLALRTMFSVLDNPAIIALLGIGLVLVILYWPAL